MKHNCITLIGQEYPEATGKIVSGVDETEFGFCPGCKDLALSIAIPMKGTIIHFGEELNA